MKAKVIKAFDGLPDGELVVRSFKPGDDVTGELAAVAIREGWASKQTADEPDGGGSPEPAPKPAEAPAKAAKGKGAKSKPVVEEEPDPPADEVDQGEGE